MGFLDIVCDGTMAAGQEALMSKLLNVSTPARLKLWL